jgi:serine protease Do
MVSPIRTKLSILIVGLACLGLGALFASTLDWTPASLATATQNGDAPTGPATSPRTLNSAFTRIARDITPAVVSVVGQRRVGGQGSGPDFDFGPFEDFFRPRSPDDDEPQFRPSGGSGVIVRDDGYILTNNHVVADMEAIRVVMNDRRTFDAEVIGQDPSTDIAVLQIEADDLPVAVFAGDDQVAVGEWVLALGNPFGLDFTMTAGIVSAIGRGNLNIINRGRNPYAIENFIQTDAAINPGNSGGPLVNISGQVIGINTAIASRTGGYQGYGFAVPISIARRVMDQLIESGVVRRAVLGVSIQAVTPLDQEALGLPTVDGVLIADFTDMDDNPAREAGLQPMDVVRAVEGEPVSTPSELQQEIAFHQPGETVELTVWRDGRERRVDVRLGERPESGTVRELARNDNEVHESALGMDVQDLTPRLIDRLEEQYDIDPAELPDGVFVRDVDPLGAAGEAGIPNTAIITRVGEQPVDSVDQYREAVGNLDPGSVVYLRIYIPQNGSHLYRAVRIPR